MKPFSLLADWVLVCWLLVSVCISLLVLWVTGEALPGVADGFSPAVLERAGQQQDGDDERVQVVYGEKGQSPAKLASEVEIQRRNKQPEVDQALQIAAEVEVVYPDNSENGR